MFLWPFVFVVSEFTGLRVQNLSADKTRNQKSQTKGQRPYVREFLPWVVGACPKGPDSKDPPSGRDGRAQVNP